MIFYYIRHGDPIYDPDSLTSLGLRQADALAKRFALYGLDKIYCSTSNRAILTAKPTCDILKKEPVLLDFQMKATPGMISTLKEKTAKGIFGYFRKKKPLIFLTVKKSEI